MRKVFISTRYVIVVVGANKAKAKCKAVRNRMFSVLKITRLVIEHRKHPFLLGFEYGIKTKT